MCAIGFIGLSWDSSAALSVSVAYPKRGRQIWHLVDDPACFSHCYREANKAADALSNAGIIHPEQHIKVYDCFNMFPRLTRGEIRLDRIGMPSIRKIRHTTAATGCG